MNTNDRNRSDRSGGIDPAALAGAAIAGAVTVFAPPGPWGPGGIIVGLTVLFLILGYDVHPHRTFPQSLAFAAVFGFVCILVIGYPLEVAFTENRSEMLSALLKEGPGVQAYSAVPPWVVLALWVAFTAAMLWHDRRRKDKR